MLTQTTTMETASFWNEPDDIYYERRWRHRDGGGITLSDNDRARLLGEFVAPEDAAPCSSELQIAYSEWFTSVVDAAKACRVKNEEKASKDPEKYVMVGAFLCERSVHPLDVDRA